jgi:hypothetical protein
MSRNEERMGAPNVLETGLAETPTQSPSSKRDLFSFTPHTEMVDLPSKGKFYPSNHPLHGEEYVEIKFMGPAQEDILTNKSLIKKGLALDRLVQSLLVDRTIDVTTMLSGDKSAIIIAARIGGFGANYDTKSQCTACAHVNEVSFDLNECKPAEIGMEGAEHVDEYGNFTVTLPKLEVQVECKLLRGEDELELYTLSENKKRNNLPETPSSDLMKKMIVSVEGETNKPKLAMFVDHNLPTLDARFLRFVYSRMNPSMITTFSFQCDSCNYINRVDMPMTTDFFWPTVK